jgi:hypothetical protein
MSASLREPEKTKSWCNHRESYDDYDNDQYEQDDRASCDAPSSALRTQALSWKPGIIHGIHISAAGSTGMSRRMRLRQ